MTLKQIHLTLLLSFSGLALGSGQLMADNSYGAIAYSGTSHISTTAQSWNSLQEAKNTALYNCNRDTPAKACYVPVEFQNACGALAIDYSGTWGGWWQSPSQAGGNGVNLALSHAKQKAIQACKQYAGPQAQCRVVAERCAVVFNF
nr:protein of unknown function (DUF4189) [uncultured bacterium]